jgi:hypothetical protein
LLLPFFEPDPSPKKKTSARREQKSLALAHKGGAVAADFITFYLKNKLGIFCMDVKKNLVNFFSNAKGLGHIRRRGKKFLQSQIKGFIFKLAMETARGKIPEQRVR